MRLAAAVLVPVPPPLPPPGVDATAYADAVLADALDVVDDLERVHASLAVPPGGEALAGRVGWPALAVVPGATVVGALDALSEAGATIGAVVAGDAPDLPTLVAGKLFSGCEDRLAAVCPAVDGGLVGLATRLPVPAWLREASVSLDDADALDRLHAAAPLRAVVVGPGWHRLRTPADVARLDPALEGWERTRALLSGSR